MAFHLAPPTASHPSLQRPVAFPASSGLSNCKAVPTDLFLTLSYGPDLRLCSEICLRLFLTIPCRWQRAATSEPVLAGALLKAFSYGSETAAWAPPKAFSETAAWPPQKPFAPGALLRALSCGSETAAWPPQKPFTLPCARTFAESSFLQFRDCRLAPPKALHPSLRPGLC